MAKAAAVRGRIMVATESFSKRFEGADHHFAKGVTRVREGHPILKGIEHLFEPLEGVHYDVEAASQAPGEVRGAEEPKAS